MQPKTNRALETIKRNQLYVLIKQVGLFYGEPLEDLREYAKEVAQKYINNLDDAIKCFEDLLKQTKVMTCQSK